MRLAEYAPATATSNRANIVGLMRVRSLNMNDAHIYCTSEPFAVHLHGKGQQGVRPRTEVVAEILADIRTRRA